MTSQVTAAPCCRYGILHTYVHRRNQSQNKNIQFPPKMAVMGQEKPWILLNLIPCITIFLMFCEMKKGIPLSTQWYVKPPLPWCKPHVQLITCLASWPHCFSWNLVIFWKRMQIQGKHWCYVLLRNLSFQVKILNLENLDLPVELERFLLILHISNNSSSFKTQLLT